METGETCTDSECILEVELKGLADGLDRHFMKTACYINLFLYPIDDI